MLARTVGLERGGENCRLRKSRRVLAAEQPSIQPRSNKMVSPGYKPWLTILRAARNQETGRTLRRFAPFPGLLTALSTGNAAKQAAAGLDNALAKWASYQRDGDFSRWLHVCLASNPIA